MIDQSQKPKKFEHRAMSSFPLSIGTALAFESLFDPRQRVYDENRPIPQRIDLSNYSEIWINLSTLYRNMLGSMDQVSFLSYYPSSIKDFILSEVEIIESLFQIEGSGHCLPKFYVNSYADFFKDKKYEKIIKRTDKTDLQKKTTELYSQTVKIILKETDEVYEFSDVIKSSGRPKALILSHFAYDLLSKKNFSELSLLESHTGQLKPHYQWNTKFHSGPKDIELSKIPFMKKTLMIFGDKTLVHPMDLRIRKQVSDLAQDKQWTPFTTQDKIDYDLNQIREDYVRHFLQSL